MERILEPHLRALGIHQGPVRLVRSLNVNDMRANNYVGTIVPVNGSQVISMAHVAQGDIG